jgi:hypothetical protein
MDHFASADLAEIVDEVRRWVLAAGWGEGSAPQRGRDERSEGKRYARSNGR